MTQSRLKHRGFLGFVLILSMLIAACGTKPSSPPPPSLSPGTTSHLPAPAQRKKVKVAITSSALPASVGAYSSLPKYLGYWEQEGLDVEVVGVAGSNVAMPMILAKDLHFAFPGTPSYLATAAQSPDVTAYYSLYPHNQYRIASLASGNIKTIADLKGTTIGVPDLSSAAVLYARAVLRAAGLDDQKDVEFLPLGNAVAQMANAFQQGHIKAIAAFDNNVGGLEALGVEMRMLKTEYDDKVGGGLVITGLKANVDSDPKTAVGIARGIAKATHFALNNSEMAVRIHWAVYPESKPSGVSEDVAMRQALAELKARLQTMRIDDTEKKLWGHVPEATFQATQQFLYDYKQIKQVRAYKDVFNDSFLTEINNWDQAAVAKQAKEFKLK